MLELITQPTIEPIPGIKTLGPSVNGASDNGHAKYKTRTLSSFLDYIKDKTPPFDLKDMTVALYGRFSSVNRNKICTNIFNWNKQGKIKISLADFIKPRRKPYTKKILYSYGNSPLKIPVTNGLKPIISPALTVIQDFYELTPELQRKVVNFITTTDV